MGRVFSKETKVKLVVGGVIGVLLCIWLGVGGTLLYQQMTANKATPTVRQTVQNDGNTLKSEEETTVSGVYESVSKSVVSITTATETQSLWGVSRSAGAGTGIIVDSKGVILTNKHVIKDASKVHIMLADGTVYQDVELLTTDPLNDIAFLKISNASGLPAATLGDSSTIKIGQKVVAIGNSLGQYQNTVTSGIISGKGRPIAASSGAGNSSTSLTDLIQTDAAINPGNSGGPLLNYAGQVVGINTAVAQGAEGIGFAIPINASKGILKQISQGKQNVKRAYLGASYLPINAEVARKFSLSRKQGALVYSSQGDPVIADSPADKAGLKKDDIITKVNGVEVGEQGGILSLVAEYAPGDTVELTIVRDGKEQAKKVTLGAY